MVESREEKFLLPCLESICHKVIVYSNREQTQEAHRAKVVLGEGEHKSLRTLAFTTEVIAQSPPALQVNSIVSACATLIVCVHNLFQGLLRA